MFTLHLNTRDAMLLTGTPDVAQFFLGNIIPPGRSCKLVLNKVAIPNLYYPVNSTNNTLNITGSFTTSVVIPAGNYTGGTLATALQTLLIAAGLLSATVTFSDTSLKLTIATNTVQTIGVAATSTALEMLGFATTTAATSIAGSYSIRLDGSLYVDIIVDGIQSETYTSDSETPDILDRIMLIDGFGSIIYHEPMYPKIINVDTTSLANLTLTLRNDRNESFTLPVTGHCAYSFIVQQGDVPDTMSSYPGKAGGIHTLPVKKRKL